MDGLQMVQLKDGSKVPDATMRTAYLSMQHLYETNPLALYELAQVARNPHHMPFGNLGQVLIDSNLVDGDGRMHDDTRHVVLSSLPGDGMNMQLVHPAADQ
jgi:hypothetical protein